MEDALAAATEAHVVAYSDLKQRLDALIVEHKAENARFSDAMRAVASAARASSAERESELLVALERERSERKRAIEIAVRFKQEGAAIIAAARRKQESGSHAKIVELQAVVEEQSELLDRMASRCTGLESELAKLRELPRGVDEQLRAVAASDQTSLEAAELHRMLRAAVARLRAEQRERLRVEEQAATFAAAQEATVQRLEAQLRQREMRHDPIDAPEPAEAVPSLEDRLTAVSAEFQTSLARWKSVVESDEQFVPS